MGAGQPERRAIVMFDRAGAAERRVAGVAAAARIVRELAEAGFSETVLALGDGGALSDAARADIRRLAGSLRVRIEPRAPTEAEADGALILDGARLVPAATLAASAPGALPADSGLRLDRPGAAAAILRGTDKPSDGPVARRLNRPVSRRISSLLLRLPGIRPIHATAATALLAAAMLAALVAGGAAGLVLGGLLFQAASIVDGVDGEIARATFRASPRGAVIDSAVDVATNVAFVLGVAVQLVLVGRWEAAALAGWGFLLFLAGLSAIAWRGWRRGGPFSLDFVKHHYRGRFSGPLVPRLIAAATIVSSRDFFALLFAALAVAGQPMAVLWLFAAAATVWILFVAASLRQAADSVFLRNA